MSLSLVQLAARNVFDRDKFLDRLPAYLVSFQDSFHEVAMHLDAMAGTDDVPVLKALVKLNMLRCGDLLHELEPAGFGLKEG